MNLKRSHCKLKRPNSGKITVKSNFSAPQIIFNVKTLYIVKTTRFKIESIYLICKNLTQISYT